MPMSVSPMKSVYPFPSPIPQTRNGVFEQHPEDIESHSNEAAFPNEDSENLGIVNIGAVQGHNEEGGEISNE
jgi:hypothetical protein